MIRRVPGGLPSARFSRQSDDPLAGWGANQQRLRRSVPNIAMDLRTALLTLDHVNAMTFQAGDRILFRAGSRFAGQLAPKGSGVIVNGKVSPIIIDMYGEGAPYFSAISNSRLRRVARRSARRSLQVRLAIP